MKNKIGNTLLWLLVVNWLLSFLPGLTFADTSKSDLDETIKDAIVKIYTVQSKPDYFSPWRMFRATQTSGSGFIIKGHRILTNAHVVANNTFIQVRRHGDSTRYRAKVLHVAHDADLALLTVDKESFFKDTKPLEFGGLPQTQKEVYAYGFPIGGDSMSITKGILSRIEHTYYAHSSSYLLAGQIDAAINPGNSGGPVIMDHKVVGVVNQGYNPKMSENIGYMVPIPIIEHFFNDIADGSYDGFPNIGLLTQKMENPDMKAMYGLKEDESGILVVQVFMNSPAVGKIEEKDVLLAIDGHSIADDATVEFRPKERTHSKYYTDLRQIGESVTLDILRQGTRSQVTIPLNTTQDDFLLVPRQQYDRLPDYYIFGGIVFSPLSKNILLRWGRNWRNNAPYDLVLASSEFPTPEKQEIVVALQILPADVNRGYHDLEPWVVEDVNGKTFKNFKEFYKLVSSCKEPYLVFRDKKKYQVVIDRQKALDTHEQILKTYRIREDRSASLKQM